MKPSPLFLLLLLLLSYFLVGSSPTWAALSTGTVGVTAPATAGVRVGAATLKELLLRPLGQGVTVVSEFETLIKNKPYVMTASRALSTGAIARAAMLGARVLGPVALAITVADIFWNPDEGRWEKIGGNEYPPGKWCAGTLQYETCGSDPAGVCEEYLGKRGFTYAHVTYQNPTSYNCFRCWNAECDQYVNVIGVNKYLTCDAGYTYNNETGLCELLGMVPATDSDIETAIKDEIDSDQEKARQQAEKSMSSTLLQDAGPIESTSGPAQSEPTVEQKLETNQTQVADQDNDGIPETQTVTKTTTTTTVYNFQYDNSVHITETTTTNTQTQTSITYSTTNETTVINNEETTNTTETQTDEPTERETDPPVQQETSPGESGEWPGFCDWASVVCDFIEWVKSEDDLPPPPVLPVEDIEAESQTWTLNLGAGTCPADVPVQLMDGKSFMFSYAIPCMVATDYIKPVVLLMCSILALYILAGVKVD